MRVIKMNLDKNALDAEKEKLKEQRKEYVKAGMWKIFGKKFFCGFVRLALIAVACLLISCIPIFCDDNKFSFSAGYEIILESEINLVMKFYDAFRDKIAFDTIFLKISLIITISVGFTYLNIFVVLKLTGFIRKKILAALNIDKWVLEELLIASTDTKIESLEKYYYALQCQDRLLSMSDPHVELRKTEEGKKLFFVGDNNTGAFESNLEENIFVQNTFDFTVFDKAFKEEFSMGPDAGALGV